MDEASESRPSADLWDYLAAERTFLAGVRTGRYCRGRSQQSLLRVRWVALQRLGTASAENVKGDEGKLEVTLDGEAQAADSGRPSLDTCRFL